MKANIKLFTSDGEDKEGFYPIKLHYPFRKEKRKTIAKSRKSDWDNKSQLPIYSHSDYENLYTHISEIRKKAASFQFKDIINLDYALEFLTKPETENRVNFYEFAQTRIDYMYHVKRNGNAEAYETAINQFKLFKDKLYFDEINLAFLEKFKEWKKTKGNKNSTIRNYLNEFRAIYNSCVRMNSLTDNRPFTGIFYNLPVPKRRVKNIYIDKEGIKKLENANFKKPATQRTVDLTLLQFYLGGLDFTDLYHLKRNNISNNRVYITRAKLGEKAYIFDVKLFKKAKLLIDKYKTSKGEYIFGWDKDRTRYKSFLRCHNRSLETVFKSLEIEVLPKHDNFTTKSVRHSFATIAKFERIDVDIIREIMGHERDDIDTVYKDKYPEKERDEAHWNIINTDL